MFNIVFKCDSKSGHQKNKCSKEIELHAYNVITINLHYDINWDTHVSFENNEESGYNLNLELLAISY